MQEPILTIDFSPYSYFKKSLEFARHEQFEDALQAIDASIIFSSSCPFYIYQKAKLLFKSQAFEICSNFIASQLDYLFKNASLYLVCRFIDYYQKINHLNTESLASFLKSRHVPYCLATEYKHLLGNPHYDLLPQINKAIVQDQYTLCISYCDLILKTQHPTNEIIFLKGYSYHMLRNLIAARSCYNKYLMLEPCDAMAHDYLGLAFMEDGLYTDALKAFQTTITLKPDNKDYLMHLAECYYVYHQYEKAAEIYELLNQKFPNDFQITFYLSNLYKKYNKKYLYHKYAKKVKKQAIAYL